jgi:putative ABC transport system substrate-binding protein
MTVIIGRRELLVALGGAAAAWPLAARAAGPRPRIAVLSINSEQDERKNIAAFVDGLRALGYVTSQNVDIDYRYAEGDTTRLKPLAQELIAFKPDVAFTNSPSPAVAVQSVAPNLPIVCPQIAISSCRASWRTMRGRVVA